jgi:hypothetical protein
VQRGNTGRKASERGAALGAQTETHTKKSHRLITAKQQINNRWIEGKATPEETGLTLAAEHSVTD